MSSVCPVRILLALALSFGSPAASGQQSANADRTIDTVEVTAQREAMRKAIDAFVSTVTRFDGANVARWRYPICPSVTGAAAREHAEFVRERILQIAKLVEAPVARNQEKCSSNLFVILTSEPDKLWATLKSRNPKIFGSLQPQRVERALSTRPIQTIQNVILNNSDGTTSYDRASYRLKDSRIVGSVTEDFTSVLVVVNDTETGRATFGQLADYIGFVALARVDLSADFANSESILRLFAASDSATPLPSTLTEWDQSFLKALYAADISSKRPRTLISSAMIGSLEPK